MNSVVLQPGKTGNKSFDKVKSTARIDGAVTLAMASGFLMALHRLNDDEGKTGAVVDVEAFFEQFEREGV